MMPGGSLRSTDRAATATSGSLPESVVIPVSRRKTVLGTAGSLAFVVVGAFLFQTGRPHLQIIGGFATLFFTACGVAWARKLLDRAHAGLELTPSGLVDRCSSVAVGFVAWDDVRGFRVWELRRQRILVVLVDHPERYLGRGGFIRRALRRANMAMCGSPVTIASTALAMNFDDLAAIAERFRVRYGRAPIR